MKKRVLFIAPYRGLKELALSLSKNQSHLDVIVEEADLSAAIPFIKYYEKENIDFIISRGGTARLIKQITDIPLVEVEVSGYDIIRSLTLIKDYKMKVHMIGFPNVCDNIQSIAKLLKINISYTTIYHENEVLHAVRAAQEIGAQVILGDTITVRTAQENGLQGMMITSGRESVLAAFEKVKEMSKLIDNVTKDKTIQQAFLANYENGIAIFDNKEQFIYCNATFAETFSKDPSEVRQQTFDKFPQLKNILHNLNAKKQEKEYKSNSSRIIVINGNPLKVHGGSFVNDNRTYLYLVIRKYGLEVNRVSNIQVFKNHVFPSSFAQMVTNSKVMKDLLDDARQLAKTNKNLIIYGEKGTGKRFVSHCIHTDSHFKEGDFIEIDVNCPTRSDLEKLFSVLNDTELGTIYFKGLNNFSLDNQKDLIQSVNCKTNIRFIFSFDLNPQLLIKNNQLFEDFKQKWVTETLFIPPLRDRKQDIEEFIRLYIAKYNTLYGKQVVGVHSDVLEEFKQFDWHENITDLKNKISSLVKNTNSDYIDKIQLEKNNNKKNNFEFPIDLTKTLKEIEEDIINFVLKEEDMNQTRTAKRLGINRTTLWRKLK